MSLLACSLDQGIYAYNQLLAGNLWLIIPITTVETKTPYGCGRFDLGPAPSHENGEMFGRFHHMNTASESGSGVVRVQQGAL